MKPRMNKYSVLLRYPDYINDNGETYYAFETAETASQALEQARARCVRESGVEIEHIDDLLPLIMTYGHNSDLLNSEFV